MTPLVLCRWIAVAAFAATPALAVGQAPVAPGGTVNYALTGGARYVSGTTVVASAGIGGEAGLSGTDSRWRIGGKALWSRVTSGETDAKETRVVVVQESQHRWRGRTWVRQRLSLSPALRAGEPIRGSVDLGVAVVLARGINFDLGLTRHYDSAAGWGAGDLRLVTVVALKLD